MANLNIPKEQQTAYERWEMSSFSEGGKVIAGNRPNSGQKKAPEPAAREIAKVLEDARNEAYGKGMQEGFAVGMDKARTYAQIEKQRFVHLITAFTEALEKSDELIADEVLALALDIAKAMLKAKLNIDETAVLPVVLDAIRHLPHVQKPAKILVHRDDFNILREYLADQIVKDDWLIQESPNVERGGCLVETGSNQVDATNETRWKRIAAALSQNNDWLEP